MEGVTKIGGETEVEAFMRKRILAAILSINLLFGGLLLGGLLFGTAQPAYAVTRYRTHSQYVRHKRHVKTAKRVGIGAAGGAAIGALAGGGKGAAIGGIAGAGAGLLYDQYQKHHHHY